MLWHDRIDDATRDDDRNASASDLQDVSDDGSDDNADDYSSNDDTGYDDSGSSDV